MFRIHRTAALVLRQYYLLRNSPARVLSLFAWVAVDIVLWGFISGYLDTLAAGHDFVPTLLGAVLLWDFFARVMYGVTMAFLEDVWTHNFLNLFASPLSLREYLSGLVMSSVATSFIGLLMMLVLATAFFGLSFLSYGIVLLPFLLMLFLFGIALGILGSAMVLRFGPSSEWLVWPIPAVVTPFAAVFYPVSTLPGWMQHVSRLLPPSYVFEGLRTVVAGKPFAASTLWCSAVLAVAYIVLASWVFARIHRGAVRSGLLARYSAESVT
jgi:ABC-2 type transport system permease protein